MTVAGGGRAQAAAPNGYFVPAEDAPHELTFMQWPASRRVHPERGFLEALQATVADVANAIADFEPVVMLAAAEDHARARRRLAETVTLWDVPTEDLWARDSGPTFAIDGQGGRVIRHIRFNGWGGKQVHRRDGRVAERVAQRLGVPLQATGLVGEAGGVEQDGHGLLIAHASSWENPNRNPGLGRQEIGQRLLAAYGAERIIWSDGLKGRDITDFHIDALARFTGPGQVLMNLAERSDRRDPFDVAARETRRRLEAAGLQVTAIPEPRRPRVRAPDFVAAYANYYVCNGAVIAAEFGDRDTDAIAFDALTEAYPDREVVMLNVDPLGEIGGGIHCATQQMPRA